MTPSTKVTASTVGAAVATILVWFAESQGWVDDVPALVVGAFTVLLTLGAGYFVNERNPSPSTIEAVRKLD